jgi:hypothetical protein
VQQYVAKLQAALASEAPRLQAVFEKPGAQELVADVQWGLLQRFAARSIKFAMGIQGGEGSGSAPPAAAISAGAAAIGTTSSSGLAGASGGSGPSGGSSGIAGSSGRGGLQPAL